MKETNVIFLDDEENILNSLKRLLINEPFGIVTTTDHNEALAIMAKEKIKVIFSDERMPNISGVEFLGTVKARYPDIIRILFTGYADITAAESAINIGEVYRFVNKPWNSQDLKKTIAQAIEHYDLVIENRNFFETTKKKNEELEVLNRKLKGMYEAQKEFTSTVSHELRTPLASIKAGIDIVMSKTSGALTADQEKFLGKAKDNVDRLNRLINDILDLAKFEAGKIELKFQKHNMNDIVREVCELQEPVAGKKGLSLKLQLDQNLAAAFMDKDRIIQLLSNLIGNSVKFTEKGGLVVSTSGQSDKNYIQVAIKDTGPGIKPEDIPKLFQKFQQLGDPATRQTGGTGLGLAICEEVVKRHGGRIWVDSEYGKGSSFYFVIPIEERRKE